MKVLIHITPKGIVGAWRIVHGGPESYYAHFADPMDSEGAHALITLKSNDLSWDMWFDRLTERSPYFIKFAQTEAPASEALSDTLERYQQESVGS
jgi:hypothetical protein